MKVKYQVSFGELIVGSSSAYFGKGEKNSVKYGFFFSKVALFLLIKKESRNHNNVCIDNISMETPLF